MMGHAGADTPPICLTPEMVYMTTLEMNAPTAIGKTALDRLDREGRLLNAVLKSPTKKPGRFGFRGDIALKFQAQLADEKRPPEFSIEQVLTIAQEGEGTIPVLAGYLHSFAWLDVASEVLDGLLSPQRHLLHVLQQHRLAGEIPRHASRHHVPCSALR